MSAGTSMGNGCGGGGAVSPSSNSSRPFDTTPPSTDEANHALSSMQQAFESSPSMLQQPGDSQDFSDAFRSLRTQPSLLSIAISLVCDKSVWEAVMNNEAVRKFIDRIAKGRMSIIGWGATNTPRRNGNTEPSKGSSPLLDFLKMFIGEMKAIAILVAEKTIEMAYTLLPSVRSSLLVSVLVILVIVVARVSLVVLSGHPGQT